jgi:hypothetical protein
MRKRGLALSIITVLAVVKLSLASALPDSGVVRAQAVPYFPGEKFTYSVEYGFISAGKAHLTVLGVDSVRGIPCYHIQSKAWSNPTFSAFFRVDDQVDSFIDIFNLKSLLMVKHLREGKYKKDFMVEFDPFLPLAYYPDGDTLETAPNVQDALSSLYYLRGQEFGVGSVIAIPNHDNKKNYPVEVKITRKERVKVPAGKFTCYVVEPYLTDVGIFKAKGKIWIWLTADEKKIPVLVKTSVIIGSVSAKLEKYEEGTPLDLEAFTIGDEDTVQGCMTSDMINDTIEPLEIGGKKDEIPPQDAGP